MDSITSTSTQDELFAGDFPVRTIAGTILSGEDLSRGTVVGKITASGKLVIVDSDNEDGSEVAYGVLMEAVDASLADKPGTIALTGDFNAGKLTFGGTDVAADHSAALRALSVFIDKTAKPVQP